MGNLSNQEGSMDTKNWAAYIVENFDINLLKPYSNNSKVHSSEQVTQIANSIKEWGWTVPILVDEDYNILAGHGRYYAALQLSLSYVPCSIAKNWSDSQKRAYIIADNKIAENSDWNNSIFYSELKALAAVDYDINLLGVDIDLSLFDYKPSLNPNSNNHEVTDYDVSKAESNLERSVHDLSHGNKDHGKSIMCPYCASEFQVTGF